MNRKNRRMTARERREQVRKSNFIVRLVIAVVALVECLLLLTFTTYSWIESSSSLIIATGQGGAGKMINNGKYISLSVANNMNYQVLVANDSAGNATLTDNEYNVEEGDGGFYRSVRYFNYARTSSADGKTFYFPKRNTTHDAITVTLPVIVRAIQPTTIPPTPMLTSSSRIRPARISPSTLIQGIRSLHSPERMLP